MKNENMNIVDVTAIGDIEKKPGTKTIGDTIKNTLKKLNDISPIKSKL